MPKIDKLTITSKNKEILQHRGNKQIPLTLVMPKPKVWVAKEAERNVCE